MPILETPDNTKGKALDADQTENVTDRWIDGLTDNDLHGHFHDT